MPLTLHGYFRSGTSYRVRLALNWKQVPFETLPVNLLKGEQGENKYKVLNPQGLVPALQLDDTTILTQSPAILEWLEEQHPEPALLPQDPTERAKVRAFCAVIGCDTHPLQNLRVMKKIRADFHDDQETAWAWARHWITLGFQTLESLAAREGQSSAFVFGSRPTLAEVYLVPQMYNARRFGVNLEAFPRLIAADAAANELEAFIAAKPENQPDAPVSD